MTVINLLVVGKGGQGVLFASEVISSLFIQKGLNVKKSEIHGLAQRGGTVVSHVRIGTLIYSPVIPKGAVDFLIVFDLKEQNHYQSYLKKAGIVITLNEKETTAFNQKKGMNLALVARFFKCYQQCFKSKNDLCFNNQQLYFFLEKALFLKRKQENIALFKEFYE